MLCGCWLQEELAGDAVLLPTWHGSGGSPSPKPPKLLGVSTKQTLLASPQGEELAWAGSIITDI